MFSREYTAYGYPHLAVPYRNPYRGPGVWRPDRAVQGVVCIPKADFVDGETLTLWSIDADGAYTSVVFEFDVAGDGVGGGNTQVNISGDTTAGDVSTTLAAAIDGSALEYIWITNDGGISLTWSWRWPGYGTAPSETVNDGDFQALVYTTGWPSDSLKPARFGPVRGVLPVDYNGSAR